MPSSTPLCCRYWKECFLVALDYGRQQLFFIPHNKVTLCHIQLVKNRLGKYLQITRERERERESQKCCNILVTYKFAVGASGGAMVSKLD